MRLIYLNNHIFIITWKSHYSIYYMILPCEQLWEFEYTYKMYDSNCVKKMYDSK